ncbi:MAG: invasion associated locus B family protein [Rickettsiaceae bacterium]|nr:invasion associated locus B family protein [Rickettsiaceae bacterium]
MTQNFTYIFNKTKFVALALIWCFLFVMNANNIYATANIKKDEKKFEDWTLVCSRNKDNKEEKCYAENIVTAKKDDKDVTIATYRIELNSKKEVKMTQILPLGTNLQSGTAIIVNSRMVAPGKYVYCLNEGCVALVEMNKSELEMILDETASAPVVGILSADGVQNNIPFTTKGLKKVLEELKNKAL